MLSVAQFADLTRRIIEQDGADDFLPTALYPERREIVALDELPEVDGRVELAIEWASARARDQEEFMLALIVAPDRFVVVRRSGGAFERHQFDFVPAA